MNNNVNDLRNWLISEIGRNQTYHNHKEITAWTATAFYFTAVLALGFNIPRHLPYCISSCITFFFIVILILALLFLRFQFLNRRLSARHVRGLIRAVARLVAGFEPQANDLVVNDLYPRFVDNESTVDERTIREWKWAESFCCGLTILGTVVSIILLWM